MNSNPFQDIEYGVRYDWDFTKGIETIMLAGKDESVALLIAKVLTDQNNAPHSVVNRIVGSKQWRESYSIAKITPTIRRAIESLIQKYDDEDIDCLRSLIGKVDN